MTLRTQISLLIALLALVWLQQSSGALAQTTPQPSLTPTIETTANGLTLTWQLPPHSQITVEAEGSRYSQVQLTGLSPGGQPGYPNLPTYSRLVGLPPSGGATLQILEIESNTVDLPHPPLPAAVPQPLHMSPLDSGPLPTGGTSLRQPNPAVYAADRFFPSDVAQLGSVEFLRNRRVARLKITPLRVNPVTQKMEIVRYLRLAIRFEQPSPLKTLDAPTAFEQALADTLLNPDAAAWTAPLPEPSLSTTAFPTENLTKVSVNSKGLHVLTYSALQQAGLPVDSLDPRTLQLGHNWPRQEVAVWVEGETDGRFDPNDRLLFYANPTFSRYASHDNYFLSYGQAPGLRMVTASASPSGLPGGTAWRSHTAEVNQYYDSHYPDHQGDHWYWDELRQPDRTSASYAFNLTNPQTSGPAATLTVWLQGYTKTFDNPDHRVAIRVNGQFVGEETWNDDKAIQANVAVSAGLLKSGSNLLNLSLPGINNILVEGTWFDALRLTYATNQGGDFQLLFSGESGQKTYTLSHWPTNALHLLDVTNPAAPRRLTGHTVGGGGGSYTLTLGDDDTTAAAYLVSPESRLKTPLALETAQQLADPPGGADYVIVTHPDFAGAVAPLAAHRANLGLRVVTVDVETIYDAYGSGRMEPEAINRFLEHTLTWPDPAPEYVLLVGDGSYDLKNYSGNQAKTFIPPYLIDVDPWWGETAADNRYVTLTGSGRLPDMMIGRLPVNTAAEAVTIVNKIIQYETNPFPGDWNAHHLFVSDDPEENFLLFFHNDSDAGYQFVSAPFEGHRYYFDDAGGAPHIYTNINALRTDFLNRFNQGASVVTFHGHSSWLQWAVESIFRYHWSDPAQNDLDNLYNQRRLPVVLEMTCFTASFHRPEYNTLDESLLRQPGGGAVAVWGSSGLGIATGHKKLQAGFYQATAGSQVTLGAATLAGKLNVAASGNNLDLVDTFLLFGDPAMTIDQTKVPLAPFTDHVYLPLIER